MTVYEVTGVGKYCGGMMIVAAEDKETALKLANAIGSHYHIHYKYATPIVGLQSNTYGVLAKHELGE